MALGKTKFKMKLFKKWLSFWDKVGRFLFNIKYEDDTEEVSNIIKKILDYDKGVKYTK